PAPHANRRTSTPAAASQRPTSLPAQNARTGRVGWNAISRPTPGATFATRVSFPLFTSQRYSRSAVAATNPPPVATLRAQTVLLRVTLNCRRARVGGLVPSKFHSRIRSTHDPASHFPSADAASTWGNPIGHLTARRCLSVRVSQNSTRSEFFTDHP